MKEKRSYGQYCGLASALDVVGERWSLLLVRNLLLGPQRYGELLAGLPGITTNLLAKRLKDLAEAGVIERSAGEGYRLTSRGQKLEAAVQALGAWGSEFLQEKDPEACHRSLAWLLVSLKRRYQGGENLSVGLMTPDDEYRVNLGSEYTATRGEAEGADVVLRGGELPLMQALVFGAPVQAIEGNPGTLERFRAALSLQ